MDAAAAASSCDASPPVGNRWKRAQSTIFSYERVLVETKAFPRAPEQLSANHAPPDLPLSMSWSVVFIDWGCGHSSARLRLPAMRHCVMIPRLHRDTISRTSSCPVRFQLFTFRLRIQLCRLTRVSS